MALARSLNAENLDRRLRHVSAEVPKLGDMAVGCDDDDGVRLALDAGFETVEKPVTFSCDGRNDDCHVAGKEGRSRSKWDRREGP